MESFFKEEQFLCVICQDFFDDPVSLICGHNFCRDCISRHWDVKNRQECPLCKQTAVMPQDLKTNTTLKDITEQFKRMNRSLSMKSAHRPPNIPVVKPRPHTFLNLTRPAGIFCNICEGNKTAAVQSCQVCQVSYCDVHLKPHQRDPVLRKHTLTGPVRFSSNNLCRKHSQPLDRFCKVDLTAVCEKCAQQEHRFHKTVTMVTESKRIKSQMRKTEAELQHMIRARVQKMEHIKLSLALSKRNTENEIERSIEAFSLLINTIEKNQAVLIEELERRQEEEVRRAEELLERLNKEIDELGRRSSELQILEHTENHVHLLQSFPSLDTALSTQNWDEFQVRSDHCIGAVRMAVSKLARNCQELEKKLSVEEVDTITQYAVDITLDPDTAAGWVVLSPDGKKVSLSFQQNVMVQDNPRRFDSCVAVLGKQSFTSGRHFWVVEVGDKTDWDLGVVKDSINRKGVVTVRPDMGYWAICRRKGSHLNACAGPPIPLYLRELPHKVAVFLDYDKGVVSFYDAEVKSHIYTYSGCDFTEPLYPYLNPCLHDNGKNLAPLVICPIQAAGQVMVV